VGTSPNGGIYSFGAGGLKTIYAAKLTKKEQSKAGKGRDANEPNDSNAVEQDKHLANEHIFAMAADESGRLLAGISGQRCVLCRLQGGELKTIFEPNDANYIFAISVDKGGDIFLGTGPKGKIYRIDSTGKRRRGSCMTAPTRTSFRLRRDLTVPFTPAPTAAGLFTG
jgi:hypothetical protein